MSHSLRDEKAIMPIAASRSDSEVGVGSNAEDKNFYTVPDERKAYFDEMRALSPEEFKELEAKVVKKMDRTIIPWITLLYLMSFLDRVNVGAAKLVGLTSELGLDSLQYSNVSMIFFVSYVAFEVPSNLVLKKFRPSRWIPFTMVIWAIFQTSMGFATNYGQMLALRFCLGIFEAGLFPGLNFYLTGWYKRDELNKRVAVFFAGAVLAGAFGGIFGFALAQMNGVGGLQGWAWIFIIEGIITFIFAVASFWMVHDWPEQAKFLTPVEREIVIYRLKKDQGLASEGKLTKRIVKRSLLDPKVYILMLMYIGAAEPLYSGSLFSPTIIASLGKFSVTQSLLLSTPPYVVCFITTCVTAYLSDKYRRRAPFLMFWSLIAMIGFIILLSVPISQPGVLYFAVFLAVMSVGPLIATTISWTGGQFCQHYKRAIAMGLVFSSGNAGGIVSSQAYRNQDAPRFLPGHGVALAFCFLCFTMAGTLWYMNSKENKRRDAVYGPPPENAEGWEAPENLERWGLTGMPRDEIVDLADNHPAWRYYV